MCQSKTWYELDVCARVCFCLWILCHKQHLRAWYCTSNSTTIAEGFVASIIHQRSAISLFLFVRMSQFMQSRAYYNVAWESKAMCNYITCMCVFVCNASTSWWQSINSFAAYCAAVNFQPQCIWYVCFAFGMLECVCVVFCPLHWCKSFLFSETIHMYSAIVLFGIHRIEHLKNLVELNKKNRRIIHSKNHRFGICWC